jgi:hypothetical protein
MDGNSDKNREIKQRDRPDCAGLSAGYYIFL